MTSIYRKILIKLLEMYSKLNCFPYIFLTMLNAIIYTERHLNSILKGMIWKLNCRNLFYGVMRIYHSTSFVLVFNTLQKFHEKRIFCYSILFFYIQFKMISGRYLSERIHFFQYENIFGLKILLYDVEMWIFSDIFY